MRFFFSVLILAGFYSSLAQTSSQWTWISGDTLINLPPVYGVKGVASPANTPGGRHHSASFTDNDGNFWLFGGAVFKTVGSNFVSYYKNDLWKYTTANNQWVWVNGDSVDNTMPVYGTKGIASATNTPGATEYPSILADKTGTIWLYGGDNGSTASYYTNELWKYNPDSNMWTWVSGDSTHSHPPVYGAKGTANLFNNPGGRETFTAWSGDNNDFWILGGNVVNGPAFSHLGKFGYRNDLWRYDIAANEWTWMSGDSIPNSNGSYGVKGVEATTNHPGITLMSAGSKDTKGNLFLFGRYYVNSNERAIVTNETWKYSPAKNIWTWVNGDSISNSKGNYGQKGVASPLNIPPGRAITSMWTDANNRAWMFGGYNRYNDLWSYNMTTNIWTWVDGDSTTGVRPAVYGTQLVSSSANALGSRYMHNIWTDKKGDLWLFGGVLAFQTEAYKQMNDMWVYRPFVKNIITLCPPVAATSMKSPVSGSIYQWQVSTDSGNTFINISNDNYYNGANAENLVLTNIPSSFYGYQYRCIVDNTGTNPTTIQFDNHWTGAVSDAWENPSNWSCGTLPDANTDVILDKGSLVISSNVACRSLRVNAGANITVKPGYTLTITH